MFFAGCFVVFRQIKELIDSEVLIADVKHDLGGAVGTIVVQRKGH
jgi:hypothetical protein